MLLIAGLVLLFLLPTPWNLIALLVGLVLWLGEVFAIWRLVRKKQVQTGVQTLIGRTATVIAPCRPLGQVRLGGESEIWRARCAAGADRGETVHVVAIDQLTLIVER